MKRACVIGWPISHSRSPLIHNYWLSRYEITGTYGIRPVEPAELQTFLDHMLAEGYSGCNVTIPHKEAVFSLLKNRDELSVRIGAINTVYSRDGSLHGTNTDGEGFMANLRSNVPDCHLVNARASILGAGGSAMAIAGALIDEKVGEIAIFNRSRERSHALAKRFGSKIKCYDWQERHYATAESAILVNTTSLGMQGQPDLEIDLSRLAPATVVADIVYVPLKTRLLACAEEHGLRTLGGLGMLLHQAVRGFALWFGVVPEVTSELYQLVANDIAPNRGT